MNKFENPNPDETIDYDLFGLNLQRILDEKHITQTELGKLLGIHPAQISLYCRCGSFPASHRIQDMAYILKVSVGEFFRPIRHEEVNVKGCRDEGDDILKAEIAKKLWDIAKISQEHGNALMDLIGYEGYYQVMMWQKSVGQS